MKISDSKNISSNEMTILSKIIVEGIDKHVVDLYSRRISKQSFQLRLHNYMQDWFVTKSVEPDLNNIATTIEFILDAALIKFDTAEIAYDKYIETRKNYKKRWWHGIQEEIGERPSKPNNKNYIEKDVEAYKFLEISNGHEITDEILKNYTLARTEEIRAWFKSKDSLLLDFRYVSSMKEDTQINALLTDLGWLCFKYIVEVQDGRYDNYLTSLPSILLTAPFFTYRSEAMNLQPKFEDGILSLGDDYIYNGNTIRTSVKTLETTEEQAADIAFVETFKREYNLDNKARTLDSMDLNTLAVLCSYGGMSNHMGFSVSLKEVCRQIYGKHKTIRTRQYLEVLLRIDKLANFVINTTRLTETGVEKSTIHLIDVHYTIPIDHSSSGAKRMIDEEIKRLLSDDGANIADEAISMLDISETYLDVIPGKTILDSWREKRMQYVYSELYKSLGDNTKAKSFVFILERARISQYPNTKIVLNFDYFSSSLRFNLKKGQMKDEIDSILRLLKNLNIIIKDYTIVSANEIPIEFLPFSDAEKYAYNIYETYTLDESIS